MYDMTYESAVKNAHHLIALGQTKVYLRDGEMPWDKAVRVETGSSYRFNGPTSCYFIAEEGGLELKWSVDFEQRDASGRGVSLFDRERLRDVALKVRPSVRSAFAELLREAVLPDLQKRTGEIREALNQQTDSEDCVRGLIAFAEAA